MKFTWKHKGIQIFKAIPSEKNYARGIPVPNFKLYYREVVTKKSHGTVMKRYLVHRNRWKTQIQSHTVIDP